jgi:poly(3-hydroxybutyrate) depolymerase
MFKRLFIAVIFCSAGLVLPAENPVKKTIHAGNFEREYLLYRPDNPRFNHPEGIIVCLHGFGRTMEDFFTNYNLSEIADSLNYILLAPQALPEQDQSLLLNANLLNLFLGENLSLNSEWFCGLEVNAGFYIGNVYIRLLDAVLNKEVDDVGFIHSLIDRTVGEEGLDFGNIFAFGTSMGGYMAYQYAMQHGDRLSGLISVAGSMGLSIKGTENPIKVPVCDFHSQTDEVVPYSGTSVKSGFSVSLAQNKAEVIDYWVKTNVAGNPVFENVNYYPSDNNITVEKISYPAPVYEVVHYRMNGSSHNYFFRKENGDCMDYVEETLKFIQTHASKTTNGIPNLPLSGPFFYPNPAEDVIGFGIDAGRVFIYDLSGKAVLTSLIRSGQLNISSLKPGTYFMRIQSEENVFTTQLIKR